MRKVRRPSFSDNDSDVDSFDSSYPSGSSRSVKPRRRRRSPDYTANGSVVQNKAFQRVLLLLVAVVLFDVVYLWDYLQGIDDTTGPEAGLHHLHESRRIGRVYQQVAALGRSERAAGVSTYDALKHEVEVWKKKYEDVVNPYLHAPFTPAPPLEQREAGHQEASRVELMNKETHGVDEHLVKILHSAGVEIDEELAQQLPTWSDITSLYGDKPIIYGLDTCEPYRQAVSPENRMTGPAGMFNTGTNLLYELLKPNCDIKEAWPKHREPKRNGMRWQVPWGKHNPPNTHRFYNIAKAWGVGMDQEPIKQDDFLPVVLIKDPYSWMGSQCRHKYASFWGHDAEHCPNLIRWKFPDEDIPSEVRVKFKLGMKLYESLLDVWNRWYQEWEEQTFPHLATRFEDLLFHGEEVTQRVCDCVGGVFTEKFRYVEDSAKPAGYGIHKGANGLVKAMLQYGDPKKRLTGFTDRDRWYASKNVNTHLMEKYGYTAPPLPTPD